VRTTRLPVALLVLVTTVAVAQPSAHVKGPDGKWKPIPVQEQDGRLLIQLAPSETPNGQATIVVNKPDWMVLDDEEAPLLLSLTVGEESIATEGDLDLGAHDSEVPPISVRVIDDANPLDAKSVRLIFPGHNLQPEIDVSAIRVPAKSAEFTVKLPELLPGVYRGELSIADLSPQSNTLRAECTLKVFGISLGAEGKEVRLASPDAAYTIDQKARLPLLIAENGVSPYVTGQVAGSWVYPREILSSEITEDAPDRKVCRITMNVGDSSGKPIDQPGHYEYDLEVRKDSPCLIVRGRVFNDVADGTVYTFWGWLPGDGYDTADGHKSWTMTYASVGQVGWIYLPSKDPKKPGTGWISPQDFGESRFGTMLLYTVPQKIDTKKGDSVETAFAIMPANSPEEVAAEAAHLAELGVFAQE